MTTSWQRDNVDGRRHTPTKARKQMSNGRQSMISYNHPKVCTFSSTCRALQRSYQGKNALIYSYLGYPEAANCFSNLKKLYLSDHFQNEKENFTLRPRKITFIISKMTIWVIHYVPYAFLKVYFALKRPNEYLCEHMK